MNEKPSRNSTTFIFALALSLAPPLGAGETPDKEGAQPEKAQTEDAAATPISPQAPTVALLDTELPVYHPPKRGAPVNRISGGTRGGEHDILIEVLAPPHTGLTTDEQPALYWFLSRPISMPVELTVADDQSVQPLLSVTLAPPVHSGLQKIALAEHGVRLEEGKDYQWAVAIIETPEQRSRDILATGSIRRVGKREDLVSQTSGASGQARARAFAEAGLWYDAVAAAAELALNPAEDGSSLKPLARLLEQGESSLAATAVRGKDAKPLAP